METLPGILRYRRDELLGLQVGDEHAQEEWWVRLLDGLGSDVAEELHELHHRGPESNHVRRRNKNSERRLRSKAKRHALHALSTNAVVAESASEGHEEYETFHEDLGDAVWLRGNEQTPGRSRMGQCPRNKRDFYTEDMLGAESFQPTVFVVEGEPDFESGPPQDGWEYLRRVKYETARCPKVVVAKIDPAKLISEQTPYMPEISDIPICASALLPSTEWENHFLGEFSLLRLALSGMLAPPTVASERIPSLRNKAAWEVCCFGTITSMQDGDFTEPDIVTTTAEPREEDSATEAKILVQPIPDPSKHVSDCGDNERRSETSEIEPPISFVDNAKTFEIEPPRSFVDIAETQLHQLLNAGTLETNYVIDLGLLTVHKPNYEDEGFCNESEYLIDGDMDVSKGSYSSVGITGPEDDPVTSSQLLDLHASNLEDLGHLEDSSFGIMTKLELLSTREQDEQQGNNESWKPPSPYPIPVDIEGDQLIGVDSTDYVAASAGILNNAEFDTSTGLETQAWLLPIEKREDADSDIEYIEPSSSHFEVPKLEDDQPHNAIFMDSLGNYAQPLDEENFGELCSGIEVQFESLPIGVPADAQSDLSFLESHEFEDVQLPITSFMDSLIGLNIFRSGNVLWDEPDSSTAASGPTGKFQIDESLEELFTRIFQLVGVSQLPLIQLLLRLDAVSRAALLRHHVSWLENVNGLPLDRAVWLLALSAVVDTPLDAQTSAAFRTVLRHCAGTRASKQTRDDEDLYMLNVLITVAGLYFGQAEAALS